MMKYELTVTPTYAIVRYGERDQAVLTVSHWDGVYTAKLDSLPYLGTWGMGPGSGQGVNAREAVADAITDYATTLLAMADELREQK